MDIWGAPEKRGNTISRKTYVTKQLHFWVTQKDYEFVSLIAAENEETIASTLRRMIRAARKLRSTPQAVGTGTEYRSF